MPGRTQGNQADVLMKQNSELRDGASWAKGKMGMFGKMQKKLHIKSHKHSHGKQVPGEYDSKPVTEKEANHLNHTDDGTENHSREDSQPSHKRGPVQLQMANAPEKTWGGKGLDSGQTYTFQRDGGDEESTQPPATQKPAAAAPQADGRQQAPAAQAADKVADMGGGPGASAASPESDLPTSGQAGLGEAEHAPVKPTKPRTAANKVVQAMVIVQAIAAGYVALLAIFILLFRVNVLWIVLYAILGFPIGLGYSWLLNTARRTRQQTAAQLRITPGQKGLAAITGEVPSWIHFSDREKVRWMNAILTEMWPFYDKAVCAMVKESVEPIMEQYKPPGLIKKMYFKHLTFGDAPFKIENVWVEEHSKDHVLMEVALRWAGDANIAIAVELPAGGEATRMVPKVSDVRINAVARITLAPLVGDMPGFGAAVVSLRKPPQIKFKLNFGKALGSSATAKPVQAWLDPFLRNTLGDMLVWPNRIVVPILGEDITGPLDHLMLRHKGVLQVWVMQAKDLHKQDVTGKADPFVELSTRVQQVEKTDKKKNTLAPVWQERKFLMVQEPTTQFLRLEMFDWDRINAKELLTLNLVKGIAETIGASTLMGRAAIPIKKYADNDGTEFDEWFEMGKGTFANDNGCGKGKGKVRLRIRYMSLGAIYSEPRRATVGAILLTLKKCEDLASADLNGYSDPYVVMKLGNGKHARQKSTIKHFTLNAEYNEKFEWVKIPYDEILDVKVYDSDTLGGDDLLGRVEIDVGREIATSPNGEVLRTWYLAEVPVDKKLGEPRPSSITMHVQWVPWDIDEAGAPPPVQEF